MVVVVVVMVRERKSGGRRIKLAFHVDKFGSNVENGLDVQ